MKTGTPHGEAVLGLGIYTRSSKLQQVVNGGSEFQTIAGSVGDKIEDIIVTSPIRIARRGPIEMDLDEGMPVSTGRD